MSTTDSHPPPATRPPNQSYPPYPPISTVYPPLVLGTATFNHQYTDPTTLPATSIIHRALDLGIRAFDTSPYYGPSETLLGTALTSPAISSCHPRTTYFLITKAGRAASSSFDYTPSAIRASVLRSLRRLGTPYLDLVYCHDCEFVPPAAVLAAVTELRALRTQGLVRYIGISGFPVSLLATRAQEILDATGEPLDAVLSYAHFCVQNTRLGDAAILEAFTKARVSVLANASILNMGLLTTRGIDAGPQAVWHPAPPALRTACHSLAPIAAQAGVGFEAVAIRWAIAMWAKKGKDFGTTYRTSMQQRKQKIGVTVIGVAAISELQDSVRAFEDAEATEGEGKERVDKAVAIVEEEMWPVLGQWKDYAWESPGEGFVNVSPGPITTED